MLGKFGLLLAVAIVAVACKVGSLQAGQHPHNSRVATKVAVIDPTRDQGDWEGWGSSLAWWGRAVGGTDNADYYADLIYTTNSIDGYPGLGLNIVRYNLGGGGINQPQENKGPKLQWQMDIHGYWIDPKSEDPSSASWNWSVDLNQRTMMLKARQRGANLFELFSDSPLWWMNFNRSTAGSKDGGNCLAPTNYDRFALYLATVARYSADHWGIKFTSVEPFNEPAADWWKFPGRQEGCHLDRNTQQTIVGKLRSALDRVQLRDVAVAASDENDVDVALESWEAFDPAARAVIGKVNVHGYFHGTESYRGRNRPVLHDAVQGKRLWQSEYGDNDASGFAMANSIILDIRQLKPKAWVYWQPVEPGENGWGLILANYLDTFDELQPSVKTLPMAFNRKFFVYGQFTRYIRPAFHVIGIDNENSIAAYDPASQKLVIISVIGDAEESVKYDLSRFKSIGTSVRRIATTMAPGGEVPDWKQHIDMLPLEAGDQKSFTSTLYPKSIYTFVVSNALR